MAQQKKRIKIPTGYKPAVREKIAQDILKTIRNRTTKQSLDKSGDKFAKYSKSYSQEKRKRKVNLKDTGDMMDALSLLTHRSGWITVGYEKGYDGMGKVEGNRKGTYGKKKPIPGKARDFLGLTQEELDSILNKYPRSSQDVFRGQQEDSLRDQARVLNNAQLERLERDAFFRRLGLDNNN